MPRPRPPQHRPTPKVLPVTKEVPVGAVAPATRVVVLGSTGSIGTNTLDVARHLPDRIQIVGLSAHANANLLGEQAREFRPRFVCLTGPGRLDPATLPPGTEALHGPDALLRMVTAAEADVVVTAIVGAAGLEGTLAAIEARKTVAVANQETLVMAGPIVMALAARHGVRLLPVDSEHSAIFQAIQTSPPGSVERIVLTGSGGPFRGRSLAELENVSVED